MNREQYNRVFGGFETNEDALEIGAWANPMIRGEHVVYMDKHPSPMTPQVQHDLEQAPLPFGTDAFRLVVMRDVLEHLCPKVINGVMRELHRIIAPGGRLILTVPYYKWHGAHSPPDHCKYFTEHSFRQWERESYKGDMVWRLVQQVRIREKDRLRYMPVEEAGHTLKRIWARRLIYRILSYMPWKYYTRHLYVVLEPAK